jgi:hypothetical protein
MLILFILAFLLIFLLLLFGGSTRSKPARPRSQLRLEPPPPADPLDRFAPRPRSRPEPRLRPAPARRTRPGLEPISGFQPRSDVFAPAQPFNHAPPVPPVTVAQIKEFFQRAPDFEGRQSNFKWDALCRPTGQPHRICSCDTCEELRSEHGLS